MQYSLFKTFFIDLLFTTMITGLSIFIYKHFNFHFKFSPLLKIFMLILAIIYYPIISIFFADFSNQVDHMFKIIQVIMMCLIIVTPSK
jgi:hypothetical protein